MRMQRGWLACLLLTTALLAGCGNSTSPTSETRGPTATPTSTPTPTPLPQPSVVYVGAGQSVYALDAHTGAKRWSYNANGTSPSGDSVGALTVAGNTLLFLNGGDNSLYALSAADGTLRWKVGGVQGPLNDGYLFVMDSVVIATSSVVQAINTTTAVDLQSGKVLWKQPIGAGSLVAGQGVLYKTRVLPGSDAEPVTNGYIQALNPTTGAVLWQANGHAFFGTSLVGNHLYAADSATGLYSFNAQTGAQEWSQSLPGINWLTPQGTTLYFGDGKKAYALDMTSHTIQWQVPFAGSILRYQNGTLCASDFQQVLHGFDATSGAELWHVSASSGYAALLAHNGLCFAGSYNTQADGAPLTAVDAKTGAIRWTAQVPDSNGMRIAGGTTLYLAAQAFNSGQNAMVWALADSDGTIQWKFDTGVAQRAYIAIG